MGEFCRDDGKVADYFGPSGNYEEAGATDDKEVVEDIGPVESTSGEPQSGCK